MPNLWRCNKCNREAKRQPGDDGKFLCTNKCGGEFEEVKDG